MYHNEAAHCSNIKVLKKSLKEGNKLIFKIQNDKVIAYKNVSDELLITKLNADKVNCLFDEAEHQEALGYKSSETYSEVEKEYSVFFSKEQQDFFCFVDREKKILSIDEVTSYIGMIASFLDKQKEKVEEINRFFDEDYNGQ